MNIDETLRRIAFEGPLEVSVGVLDALQRSFLLNVPFENLDIHLGRPIELEPDAIEEKIVARRRGGFCYECNSLFHDLLRDIGFDVRMCSARMLFEGGQLSPSFEHMVLIVRLRGRDCLVDVGNGESLRAPLWLDSRELSQTPEGKVYRLGRYKGLRALQVRAADAASWQLQYAFTIESCELSDFAARCRYQQTSDDSAFTRRKLVTLARHDGRATLLGRNLKVVRAGAVIEEEDLPDDSAYRNCLRDRFGIRI